MPTGGLDVAAIGTALGSAGLGEAVGAAALGGELGFGIGGLESAISGGNPLTGALKGGVGGALTGGGIGLGGAALGGALGATAGDVIGGAAGGALGSAVTGGKPLTGAIEGGISGGIASQLAPSTTSAAPAGASGPSAGSIAAPAGIGGPDTSNLTSLDSSTLDGLRSGNVLPTGTGSAGGIGTSASAPLDSNFGTPQLPGNAATGKFDLSGNFGGAASPGGGDISSSLGSAAAAASAKAPTSVDTFLSNPGTKTGFDVIKANPGAAISAAGLGLDVLKGNQAVSGEKQLKAQAGQLAGQGKDLAGYLQSGTLPPGLQAGVTQAADAAKATIRSRYAAQGSSGSSAEQQELAAVDQRAQAEGAQMALQLLNTGISESGMAAQLYSAIMGESLKKDQGLSSAIGNFASAAAGGGQVGRGGVSYIPVQQGQ